MHISLPPELESLLKAYIKPRKKTASGAIQDALNLLFTLENVDADKQTALKFCIEKHFVVPKNIPYSSFYIFLYLLSKSYKEANAKQFWTHTVYKEIIEKTHFEIFKEIEEEYKSVILKDVDGK